MDVRNSFKSYFCATGTQAGIGVGYTQGPFEVVIPGWFIAFRYTGRGVRAGGEVCSGGEYESQAEMPSAASWYEVTRPDGTVQTYTEPFVGTYNGPRYTVPQSIAGRTFVELILNGGERFSAPEPQPAAPLPPPLLPPTVRPAPPEVGSEPDRRSPVVRTSPPPIAPPVAPPGIEPVAPPTTRPQPSAPPAMPGSPAFPTLVPPTRTMPPVSPPDRQGTRHGRPVFVPLPTPPVIPTPPDQRRIGVNDVRAPERSVQPSLEGIATETARIERKLELLMKNQAGPGDNSDLLQLLLELAELLRSGHDGGAYLITSECRRNPDGSPAAPWVSSWEPGESQLGLINAKLDALAYLMQLHKDLPTHVCRQPPPAGQRVWVTFDVDPS